MASRKQVKRSPSEAFIWLIVGVLFLYFLLNQVGYLNEYLRAFRSVNYAWLGLALGVTSITYVFATMVIVGASRTALPFGQILVLQIATSFVNRITPKSIGGIALTQRFLEKSSLGRPGAIATISLAYFAGFIMHMTVTFLLFATSAKIWPFAWPSHWSIIAIVIGGLMVIGLGFIPKIKRVIVSYATEGFKNLRHVVTSPAKVGQLFGGSLGVTLSFGLTFYCCIVAFGISLPLTQVLLVYLVGTVLASAAPTPGGLGATEASLVGGLIALGVVTEPAVVAVLAFRAVSFWLPILPGIIALRYLRVKRLV